MPVLPLTLYVILCVHAYGFIAGTIISWLGVVAGTYTVFFFCRKFVNANFMSGLNQDDQLNALFILLIDRA